MAIERGWTGFEGGDSGRMQQDPFRGAVYGDGTARTGEFHCRHLSRSAFANTGQEYRRLDATLGTGLANGEKARINYRVFIRLHAHVGTTGCRGGGIGTASNSQKGQFTLDTTGHVAAASNDVIGSYSTNALALNEWYRIDLKYENTQGAGANCTLLVTVSIYTAGGAFIETVTQTQAIAANAALPVAICIGNASTSGSSTFDYSFDDLFFDARDKADAVSDFAFPTATRISRVGATAQGASATWAGDFRTVTDVPLETNFVDEQSTAVNGNTTTFAHATAPNLGLGNVAGIIVCAAMKASGGAGNDALMLNGVEYIVATPAAYSVELIGVDYSAYTATQFNAMEFGARNKRGVAIQLGKCYLEVLHDGTGLVAPFLNGSGVYRHKIVSWTGNGTYQTITGVGFGAQAIIIKPINDAGDFAYWKISSAGGTFGRRNGGGNESQGVLEITADGCKLGPSTSVNEAGTTYVGIFMQDGGLGSGGYGLDIGSYIGDSVDGRAIVLRNPFQPDLVFTFGPNVPFFRTKDMVGDFSAGLNNTGTTNDRIQAFNASGFEVGTDAAVNSGGTGGYGVVYSYIALKINDPLTIATGKLTPTGATFTVTGIAFAPFFACAKRIAVVNSFFRVSGVHAGANSTPWPGGVNDVNGITSLTADGFTGGSQVSAAGVETHWFVLSGAAGSDPTGVYKLTPGKLDDTLYDRSTTPVSTRHVKIPDPRWKTGLLGE